MKRNYQRMLRIFDEISKMGIDEATLKVRKSISDNEGIVLDMCDEGMMVYYDANTWELPPEVCEDWIRFKNRLHEIKLRPSFGSLIVEKDNEFLGVIKVEYYDL